MKIRYASKTDKGITRDHNEDHFLNSKTFSLNMVADGMGGYECGEVASQLALTSVIDYLKSCTNQSGVFTERTFKHAIEYSNACINQYKTKNENIKKMGTTFVCFAPGSSGGYAFNIGDSRLYRYRQGKLNQMTKDNSAEQEVLPDFMSNASDGKYSSVLTRALGIDSKVKIDSYVFDFAKNDLLLLCTDGLYSMVPDENLIRILSKSKPLYEKCQNLIDLANDAGGEDNITATILFVESKEDPTHIEMVEDLQPDPEQPD